MNNQYSVNKPNTNKFLKAIAHDLWVILLDVVAVNASYYLALLIRFYVNSEFRPTVSYLLGDWASFAPWYTVISIAVFMFWRLYGGMWRYAGINDMNRIIGANLCTTVVQVVGTLLFVRRMPITYYVIGAVLQFFFVSTIRFSYRLFVMEKNRIRYLTNAKLNVMIVGTGETARILRGQIENDSTNVARPVCIFSYKDSQDGAMMNGLPVVTGLDKLSEQIQKYQVKCVILADSLMPVDVRMKIRETCQESGVEVQNFSGFMAQEGSGLTAKRLLEYTDGPVDIIVNGLTASFENGEKALMNLNGNYNVQRIYAEGGKLVVVLTVETVILNDLQKAWVKEEEEKEGKEISFF